MELLTPTILDNTSPNYARLNKLPSCSKLSSLSVELDEEDEILSVTDSEAESELEAPTTPTLGALRILALAKRQQSAPGWKRPPTHRNMPVCVQAVLKLWKRILGREDISVMSDLIYELEVDEDELVALVSGMQALGVDISMQQCLTLQRCCIYHIFLASVSVDIEY